jgi:cytochrome c biogenesis protein CcmG/thiol:disulfide interchange protein DsbE
MSQVEMGLEGVPTTILVDREGRVAKTYVGAVRERDFRVDVEALLGEH